MLLVQMMSMIKTELLGFRPLLDFFFRPRLLGDRPGIVLFNLTYLRIESKARNDAMNAL